MKQCETCVKQRVASRSPRSSGPFTQRHSRATSVALASVRSPLAWRCHMGFHKTQVGHCKSFAPFVGPWEVCENCDPLSTARSAREWTLKLESITQAQISFGGPWDQTCLKPGPILPEGFKSFLYRACVRRKGLKQSLKRRTPKRYRQRLSSEHHDCHVASSSFCLAYILACWGLRNGSCVLVAGFNSPLRTGGSCWCAQWPSRGC